VTSNLLRTVAALLIALIGPIEAPAHSTPTHAMPSTKAIFFTSGIQQRLESVIRADDPAAIAELLAGGAEANARGLRDVTPLMIAVDAQSPRAVAALLNARANPNLRAVDGAGAVHLAVENRAVSPNGHAILEMIMKGGGDPNTRRPDNDPVIMRFVYDHDLDDLRWFKSLGADVDIPARTSRPLIADAAFAQNWDGVWCLIELGARYDYEDTLYPLSEALDSSYASSPDALLYPYKMKVWQLLKDKGLLRKPMKRFNPS
jgi:Ankyrin repeat